MDPRDGRNTFPLISDETLYGAPIGALGWSLPIVIAINKA
jgi:hypothetical protein